MPINEVSGRPHNDKIKMQEASTNTYNRLRDAYLILLELDSIKNYTH